MAKRINKVFRVENVAIGVTIEPDGWVNVAATGTISAQAFARLASSVLCESNTICEGWVGFPARNDLEDYDR